MRRMPVVRGTAAVMAFFTLTTVSASTLMFTYSGAINKALNINTSKIVETDDASAVNTAYYDSEFGTDYTNKQAALKVEMEVATENVAQAEEGTVLLRNENAALPLADTSRVTIFGNGAAHSTMGKSTTSSVASIPTMTFGAAMQKVFGADNVNTTLLDNAYASLGATTATEVVEAPISDVEKYASSWSGDYNDAAIAVFTRLGGESNDTAMFGKDGSHFLGLQANEKDLMSYLKAQKAAGVFKKIVVIINADQMMELDWLDDYDVDACVLAGVPGVIGYEGVANVLAGKVSPSGHLVDTYAANSLSAPATTYACENMQLWGNVDYVNSKATDLSNDGINVDYYTICAEGIYVGYKYYETRYEDAVMGSGDASSSVGSSTGNGWNYADEVVYPFGYGLSYTDFTQTLKGVTFNADTDNYEVEVEVTNTGDVAGKSVVEVYAQTPYGDYEKQNSIEKSAVQVVGFEKTDTLEPDQSQTVTVECERYMLASYDAKGAKGYILSAGDYYLSVGDDSHDALNNILAAKGYTTANGMTADGDAAKVYSWNQAEQDTTTYKMSRADDTVEVTNQFDNADLNYYGVDFTYLSRSDWSGTYPASVVSVDATDEMIDDLNLAWYETPADAPAVSDFTQGADNGLKFIDMRLVEWNDDEQWDAFLDQLTVADMTALMPDTFGVAGLDKVGMPAQKRADDCLGVGSTMIATGDNCLSWVSEVMTARTWNRDRMERKGSLMAIQAAYAGVNEVWYGGGNTHRTPFSGRNQQYYSEDSNYGYMVGAVEAAAMQANGVNYCVKHFAMNDQESGRESLSTFANEQTVRETYLRAFEGAFVEGGAQSVMTAFNRIGVVYAAVNVPLLKNVLRGEWGFKGHITTDGFAKTSTYKTHYMEMITAGVDFLCLDPGETAAAVTAAIDGGDGYIMQQLRRATKANVYAASRSISANGLSSNSIVVNIVPWWEMVLLVVTAICGITFIGCTAACVVMTYGKKNKKVEG